MKIELLYFEGCPFWREGLAVLQDVLANEGLPQEIEMLEITGPEQAQAERFLGSPSFRVNGADLWPEEREHYTLTCRTYATPDGLKGAPTPVMLRERLLTHTTQPD